MSDNILSQEEIEALLRGDDAGDSGEEETSSQEENFDDILSDMEKDTLGEIGNMSFGSAATALSALLGQKVDITTPTTSVISREELVDEFVQPYVAVQVEYTVGLTGANLLVIKQSDAAIIADLMLGGDGTDPDPDLSEIHLSAVQEAMNQMMGSAATSMSTIFNKKVDISPPTTDIMDISLDKGTEHIPEESPLIRVSFNLKVGELIDSNIMQLFQIDFAKGLVSDLEKVMMGGGDEEEEDIPAVDLSAPVQEPTPEPAPQPQPQQPVQQQPVQQAPPVAPPPVQQQQPVNVQQPQFANFEAPQLNEEETHNLNLLMDIPLEVTVELGRTQRSVKEILEMSSGSIIELDKLAGEPVDILVNNRYIAKGEVVVIDENFGVRITDILSQADRLHNLR
ncbi:flagellar motor switch phosphatase FliY [Savagea faecisuis]|uniref:Flagellar motor switch phosphatase FliY n=1 Tax=Savagea faecisuis TaxID=1274803 RepID=A0ABW3GVV9_9BACL